MLYRVYNTENDEEYEFRTQKQAFNFMKRKVRWFEWRTEILRGY